MGSCMPHQQTRLKCITHPLLAIAAGYIVYDTHNLVQRYELDQYIWAAVHLYLDIINLFLKMLQLLNGGRR